MSWIKMRTDLAEEVEVIRIARRLKIEEDLVVGKLHRFWSWANIHTTDGKADMPPEWLDDYVRLPGFAKAMVAVGWLEIAGDSIVVPKFERHNGESAKARCMTAVRVNKHRTRYQTYLKSDHWIEFRAQILADCPACERCGNAFDLQVHHKHYKTLGWETRADVEVLCDTCHSIHHGIVLG